MNFDLLTLACAVGACFNGVGWALSHKARMRNLKLAEDAIARTDKVIVFNDKLFADKQKLSADHEAQLRGIAKMELIQFYDLWLAGADRELKVADDTFRFNGLRGCLDLYMGSVPELATIQAYATELQNHWLDYLFQGQEYPFNESFEDFDKVTDEGRADMNVKRRDFVKFMIEELTHNGR